MVKRFSLKILYSNTCWKEKEGKKTTTTNYYLLGFRKRKNIVFAFISHLSYNEKFSQGLSVSCHEMRILTEDKLWKLN